jgi:hypothetical protein
MTIPNKEKYFSKEFFTNLIDFEERTHDSEEYYPFSKQDLEKSIRIDSFSDQDLETYIRDPFSDQDPENIFHDPFPAQDPEKYRHDSYSDQEITTYKEDYTSVTYYCEEMEIFNVNSSKIAAIPTATDEFDDKTELNFHIPSLNGKWHGFSFTNYALFAVHERYMKETILISNWKKFKYEVGGVIFTKFIICDNLALYDMFGLLRYFDDFEKYNFKKRGIVHDALDPMGNLYVYLTDENLAGIVWLDFQRGRIITDFLNGWKSMDIKKRLYK